MAAAQMLGSDPALQAASVPEVTVAPSMQGVDYSQALAHAGMGTVATLPGRTPQIGAPETPAAYTGELDRYGLGGWTPEVPGDPVADSFDFTKELRDWAKDLTGNNPTVNTVIDVLTTPGFKTLADDWDPRSAKAKEDAIVAKAKTAPKGNLERIAVQKAAADKERTRMHDLAVAQAAARHEQNVAAAQAKHEENLRVAELTRQAVARQQQAAAQQAQIAREVQAAQDRVRQARAIMNSRDYQESGLDGLSPAERDIVAAAQVDTFASGGDRSGEVREAMRSVGYGGPEWT